MLHTPQKGDNEEEKVDEKMKVTTEYEDATVERLKLACDKLIAKYTANKKEFMEHFMNGCTEIDVTSDTFTEDITKWGLCVHITFVRCGEEKKA